ncbi:IS66 family insertion sequence element accessory protein TnpB [Methyloglobulus sp.]|uniref:IS66 family insertion sequence element accessory protein TnpB n=1 Tax=Methyloglobulus sp. TaxID=2518622 RepID=UPI0032B797AA
MMQFSEPTWSVYICAKPVDFRKGMSSLAVLVEAQLKLDPFAEAVFVFSNRRSNAIKALYWERNGFCLWQKRLEKDRFVWPKANNTGVVSLTIQQLKWLLSGFDVNRMKPHQTLNYHSVL